jgi:hypothetical protein
VSAASACGWETHQHLASRGGGGEQAMHLNRHVFPFQFHLNSIDIVNERNQNESSPRNSFSYCLACAELRVRFIKET